MNDAFFGFFFYPIQSYPLLSTPIQSDSVRFFGVGLAFYVHLRVNAVDRKNLPLLEPDMIFIFFEDSPTV